MNIDKIINNNIVTAIERMVKEVVIMGRGIGFGTKAGRPIAENKLRKPSVRQPEQSGSV